MLRLIKKILSLNLVSVLFFMNIINVFAIETEDTVDDIITFGSSETDKTTKIKIARSRYDLSNEKILEIEKKLKNKYKIISSKPYGEGSFSLAYLISNGKNNYVIKLPKPQTKANKQWMEEKLQTESLKREIFKDYDNEIGISYIKEFGDDYIIEEDMGKTTLLDCYNELTTKEKREISEKIARLIIYLMDRGNTAKIQQYTSIFDNKIRSNIIKDFVCRDENETVCKFKTRDISDELFTWVLPDLHLGNIIYNRETRKINIIDLDGIKKDCIYRNFLSNAVIFNEQKGICEFINDIIDDINKFRPGTIDKEKFNLFYDIENLAVGYACFG